MMMNKNKKWPESRWWWINRFVLSFKDGCLFLQMGLFILGRSKQLGYPPDDELFGKKHNSKEMTRWIKSMFFVGNQIPFLVLKELMKQHFFQNVIKEGKGDEFPSDLSKRVLHRFLLLVDYLDPWFQCCTSTSIAYWKLVVLRNLNFSGFYLYNRLTFFSLFLSYRSEKA